MEGGGGRWMDEMGWMDTWILLLAAQQPVVALEEGREEGQQDVCLYDKGKASGVERVGGESSKVRRWLAAVAHAVSSWRWRGSSMDRSLSVSVMRLQTLRSGHDSTVGLD